MYITIILKGLENMEREPVFVLVWFLNFFYITKCSVYLIKTLSIRFKT